MHKVGTCGVGVGEDKGDESRGLGEGRMGMGNAGGKKREGRGGGNEETVRPTRMSHL